ncbi:60S ribosomal protein L44 [Tritrichomonas foetus]|uniref:60S ribosomal protein L44 n=1 Tax=Tritrichomonas foetus TaxID=1144522 RepID=A0A1J4JUC4_9EUKA|nr:60S ribosomal protein L44 [Tritrichomonas foetus]OHT06375.1 60S ribosomal protein L44 [Tritrichomonas foetus]OHT14981.1 60S ribosomal protein L44 [Tritrichomonas foetus]OHT15432.1 60S ribosomal protein L44 [Tritrichomonas foetus]|eukprot:OHT02314.1 60S ribosomal protein L44 [Tritrichomonas foetus]
MVHHPKTKKFYCKFCKKHQNHKVAQASRGEERKCALGRRRYDRKQEGFVGRVKPLLRRSKKTSKKISLRFTCQSCKKSSMYCLGRLRKFEWMVDKKKKHAEPTW